MMKIDPPISSMTRVQKMQLMEELWKELSKEENDAAPPAWHLEVLAHRQAEAKAGRNKSSKFEDVKKRLREKYS